VSGVTVADLKAMFKKFAETPIVKQRSAKSGKTTTLPSESSRKHLRAATSIFFSSAVDANIIKVNPVSSVRESRKHKKRETDFDAIAEDAPSRTKFLTKEERAALLKAAEGTPAWSALYLMDSLGLRPSEARAVRPKDFNFSGKDIHLNIEGQKLTWYEGRLLVHRSLQEDGSIGTTKTGKARTVCVPKHLADYVKSLTIDEEATICQNGDGKPLEPRRFNKLVNDAVVAAVLPEDKKLPPQVTSYWLRHSWVSRLAAFGDLVSLASQGGHDLAVLCKVYAHADPLAERALIDKSEGL